MHHRPLSRAVSLCLALGAAPFAHAGAVASGLEHVSLLDQADGLPADFREHFFDIPLTLRVERDGDYLGDAKVVLFADNRVQLVSFSDSQDSRLPDAERQRWAALLAEPRALGACSESCEGDLLALHYSLESSVLSLLTRQAGEQARSAQYHAPPEGGSRGLILRNQLNLYGDERAVGGSYSADLIGSLGHWTTVGTYQVYRGSSEGDDLRHSVQNLYAQREHQGHFLRAGFFVPQFQGILRQPRTPNSPAFTTLGLMAGSSDVLAVDRSSASLYPLYVTANREGSVELYRNGALIYSQAVQPGLQLIDTRRLPGGIYEVEVRVIEDGRIASRQNEQIYKPNHWKDASQRWRYSVFAGQQRTLLDSVDNPDRGELAAGGILNYLAHPRAVLGLSVQQFGQQRAVGASLDWHAHERANLYANVYHSNQGGMAADVQALYRYGTGSFSLNHGRSWQDRSRELQTRAGWVQSTALSWNHRFDDRTHVSARVSHAQGATTGVGVDLSLNQRRTLFGSDANLRLSVFDRPISTFTERRGRNRGVELNLNLALGRADRRYSGSLGSRTGSTGGRDLYASVGVQQSFEEAAVRSVNASLTADRYGLGAGAGAQFEHPALRGDAYAQRSSLDGSISGGLNLESTVALGGGHLSSAGSHGSSAHTGVIIDVDSELPAVDLRADDSHGQSVVLRPGRNFVPVSAYRSGSLQLDFNGRHAPAAVIQPSSAGYHLNKGGVAYQQIRVLRTVTVVGQLVGADGMPLKGAQVFNHAGRSVAEADGFFTLEMSARTPTLEVRHPRAQGCTFSLDDKITAATGDTWMAGVLQCPPTGLAASPPLAGAARHPHPSPLDVQRTHEQE